MGGNLSPKVKALYEAVLELIVENVDVRGAKVSDITGRAGIGKGTAYEYFTNKEEIIGNALLYHIDLFCGQIMESIRGMDDFSSMVEYIFTCLDREIQKRDCLVQFIHLATDNSSISKLLHKKIKEGRPDICMPQDVIDQMIQAGIKQGKIQEKLPFLYMRMVIMSKVLVYIFYIIDERASGECGKEQMHRLLCEGLLKELGG